jgi:multidrug efflux pump subunit AcrA (membrane-fusion protein)
MKKSILAILNKPKATISVAFVVAIILGVWLYPIVGRAPKTDVVLPFDGSANAMSDNTISLSFPKSGRVESVLVKKGDTVQKGQVLATLSAPDTLGVVSQTKGALALAEAQYAALDLNYANTKKQQDIIVDNAYQTLLKTTPEAVAKDEATDNYTKTYPTPVISGNYLLGKEGTITIKTYAAVGGMSFVASGLVDDSNTITTNAVPIGDSGLSIHFIGTIDPNLTWTIQIPDTRSAAYAANKNAYDLAVVNRDKILSELAQNIGTGDGQASVAKAQVEAARGAYQAALGAYQSNVITSPITGTVDFVDDNLKIGQSVSSGKAVVSISAN